jgi:hypothetical protein
MVSTFINTRVNSDANLGVRSFDDTPPVCLYQNRSESEVEIAIRAVYRQILGNAHVMESERLVVAESQLKQGNISVRGFVREVAQSDLYRTLFFETCSRTRSIELNFKHLLGRAPDSHAEIAEHGRLLDWGGLEAEIASYIDSDEYLDAFGEDTVPYYQGNKSQTGKKMVGFTHLFQLLRGAASSDKDPIHQNRARLNASLMKDRPSTIYPIKGAPLPWKSPGASDINQIVLKVLGMKSEAPDRTWTQPTLPKVSGADPDRQNQFYQAYQPFKETAPVELCPGFSSEDADVVIRAVYRQVMGNAHVMESERSIVAESQLKRGELTVRAFVRRLAKSAFYRSRFFESCDRYRSMELNYKHLLGRAPDNFDEMRYHSNVLDRDGFEADIDTYLDSDEYQTAFGDAIVPYYRGYRTQAGQSMLEFTNMLQLLQSASSSDRNLATNNKPQLTRAIIQNSPYGKQRIGDVSAILAEVFKRQDADPQIPVWTPSRDYATEQALQQANNEQAQTIDRLQKQLADLRPFASIGSAYLNNNGQTVGGSAPTTLKGKVDSQAAQIAMLQDQIADARRYATIGEARLNKWRSRVFNS